MTAVIARSFPPASAARVTAIDAFVTITLFSGFGLWPSDAAYDWSLPESRLNVFAFPIHLRTNGCSQMWQADSTGTENLRKLDIAVHEWTALLLHKLKGYSDDWFAGPLDTATAAQLDLIPARNPPARSLLREERNVGAVLVKGFISI